MKKIIKLFAVIFILSGFENSFSQSGWSELTFPANSPGIDMHFINSKTGFVVTYNSEFLKTSDGGLSWTLSQAPDISNTSSVFFINNMTGFLSQGSSVYKTTNAGANWTRKYYSELNLGLSKIRFANAQTGYACGDYRTIIKTNDAGENWSVVVQSTTGSIETLYDINVVNSENVYACGFSLFDHPVFIKSSDGGNSWSGTAPGANDHVYFQIYFVDAGTGFLAGGGSQGKLFKTLNGGNNWSRIISSPFVPYFSSCRFINANTGYLGSGSGTIYKTTNGGVNLTAQYSLKSTDEIKQIIFTGNDTGYAITNQNFLKTITGGSSVGINLISGITPDKFSLSQNYPNPFNPATTISWQLPSADFVRLKIYNSVGYEVETLVNEKQNAGSYSVNFSAASLPSGIYFYKLDTENFSETKKMILVK